ncbi:MAG: hypothetical protein ACRCZP_08240 [Phycicoccus sp.]
MNDDLAPLLAPLDAADGVRYRQGRVAATGSTLTVTVAGYDVEAMPFLGPIGDYTVGASVAVLVIGARFLTLGPINSPT